MITKAAIEKAIEGGWSNINCPNCLNPWVGHQQTRIGNRFCTTGPDFHRTALDHSFWQALGKALKWKERCRDCGFRHWRKVTSRESSCDCVHYIPCTGWEYEAHRFYDFVLNGGDTEKFWEELGL